METTAPTIMPFSAVTPESEPAPICHRRANPAPLRAPTTIPAR